MYDVSYVSSDIDIHLKTRTVVGWKTGVAARLRAEAEVGSVIGRAWMEETAYRINGRDQRMQSDCAPRTMTIG